MESVLDYRNMTALEALGLALDEAKQSRRESTGERLTLAILANRTGLGAEALQRYFNVHDDYTPGFQHIVVLCRALDNTILLDWLTEQLRDMLPRQAMDDCAQVARASIRVSKQAGRFAALVEDVIADEIVEPHEASELSGALLEIENMCRSNRERLQPVIERDKLRVRRR
ncbi:MAG: hypothetical protein AUJ49_04915 [Desulfovibrionaceae bacterium CG1_02_65_16]|nr:MAG: hypothetical protein AUJ49_04915 [Desulfovibrionaceae bacterium CG1_02_65_16]